MGLRLIRKGFIFLVTFVALFFSSNMQAENKTPNAMVYLEKNGPILIEDLQFMTLGGLKYNRFMSATWKGGSASYLMFKDIKTIRYLNPGKGNEAEVSFNDGKKDTFFLKTGTFQGISQFGTPWSISARQVVKIEFRSSTPGKPKTAAEATNYDQILLKNADTISGQIKTEAFRLRTSYGDLNFHTPQIAYIDFEGGDQNMDVIVLNIGDRLSGVIETPVITLRTRSGTEVKLDKVKIKRITFKK